MPFKVLPASSLSMEPWELALDLWVDLQTQGYSIEEKLVLQRLPEIAARIPSPTKKPSSDPMAAAANEVMQLFKPSKTGGPPLFMALLRPQHGRVHFLYFWKAFGEVIHIAGGKSTEGLAAELEILRDRLLRRIEETALQQGQEGGIGPAGSPTSTLLPTWALVEEVHRAGSMSAFPRFWQRASDHLAGQLQLQDVNIEELTSVLLVWLHDSQVWEVEQRMQHPSQGIIRSNSVLDEDPGLPVYVHIYDVSQEEGIQKLNRILAHKKSPLKFGGVFHAGVEVNGLEFAYGYSACESRPGVCCVEPRSHPQHHFRQTVQLRNTKVPAEEIANIISELIEDYPGHDYNLLRRNCCHFADDFCIRLGVGGIPGWVHRLARLGAGIETMLQNAPRPIKERFLG